MKAARKVALAFALCAPLVASGGAFNVAPIKIFFEPGSTTAVLKIKNAAAEKLTVQLDARSWAQDENGNDVYAPTKDLIIFPKLADIEAGAERIVRVGYRGEPATTERTYRLFVKELPVREPGELAFKFALNLGVPVFIEPLQPEARKAIEALVVKAGKLAVRVANSGNRHVVISRITATGLDAAGGEAFAGEMAGWYVLAGAARNFTMDLPAPGCARSTTIKVAVSDQGSSTEGETAVSAAQCAAPAE